WLGALAFMDMMVRPPAGLPLTPAGTIPAALRPGPGPGMFAGGRGAAGPRKTAWDPPAGESQAPALGDTTLPGLPPTRFEDRYGPTAMGTTNRTAPWPTTVMSLTLISSTRRK